VADTLQWAVVGSGGIARRRTIPEGFVGARGARLVGVFDVDREANRAAAKQFGVAAFRSLRGALAAEVDAVYLATPAHLHARQAVACAKAGKHVLCEKPLAMDEAESREMIETARAQIAELEETLSKATRVLARNSADFGAESAEKRTDQQDAFESDVEQPGRLTHDLADGRQRDRHHGVERNAKQAEKVTPVHADPSLEAGR